jgi:localization factor PodJL
MNAPELSIDPLPPTIGGPALRAAAIAGDMAAQYEIAARFGEGRGVPRNERQAAYWLELAAKQGLAPAQFRLGGYYEKGIGVKKDLAAARDLYLAAAAKGNGKAMHNLAVLYADGVNGRSDYRTAALWFRKAADRGIADSQFNLAILYARGSGEPQNYAEAYKWFALAAKQGDVEAANKRDEIAAQLDEQALSAVDLVVKSWKPEPQPDEAVKVKTPPGGWDAAIQTPKPKPRTKSANLAGPDSKTN